MKGHNMVCFIPYSGFNEVQGNHRNYWHLLIFVRMEQIRTTRQWKWNIKGFGARQLKISCLWKNFKLRCMNKRRGIQQNTPICIYKTIISQFQTQIVRRPTGWLIDRLFCVLRLSRIGSSSAKSRRALKKDKSERSKKFTHFSLKRNFLLKIFH